MSRRQPKDFKVARRRGEPIEFRLEGDDTVYSFTPPKQSTMLFAMLDGDEEDDMLQVRVTFDWLSEGLPEDQNDKLVSRLRDPKDDVDTDTLGDIVEWLMEESSGRPTS